MPKKSAYEQGLVWLARREHSVREVFWKLTQKEYSAKEIEEAIQRLQKDRYLDNTRFIGCVIRARVSQGSGPLKITAELNGHEILEPQIFSHEEWGQVDWLKLAYQVKVKKFGDQPPTDFKDRAKQMNFLSRRGFTATQCAYACSEKALSFSEESR